MNRSLTAIAALLLATALPSDAQQRVYQWKDAKGVTHYTDMPPPQAHRRMRRVEVARTTAS